MHNKRERRCVACRINKQQDEMLRVAKIDDTYVLDINGKLGGRGAYVCKEKACIDLAIKKRLLNRAFKSNVEHTLYEKLGEYEQNN